MLTFKKLEWDNCFSYGTNNYIQLDENPLTQLVGINGSGKTAISLILQEILYGRNIKSIKKQDLVNNKSGETGYWIKLMFTVDNDNYDLVLDRRSTLKLKLYKNGTDNSSHNSLDTYKTIASIIGIDDFKVFCQLIYQHSTDSLEFLTATDMNRKKFLISLLQLDKYTELFELFKTKTAENTVTLNRIQGKVDIIESWISQHENMDLIKQELIPITPINSELFDKLNEYKHQIANINKINRSIALNNSYKQDLNKLNSKYYLESAPALPIHSSNDLQVDINVCKSKLNLVRETIKKLNKAEGECPNCLQIVDNEQKSLMLSKQRMQAEALLTEINELIPKQLKTIELEKEIKRYAKEKAEFNRLFPLIDNELNKESLDLQDLITKEAACKTLLETAQNKERKNNTENLNISAHNSKVDVIKEQLNDFQTDILDKNIELIESENLGNILELLKKTFGTNGLVSYKIESSVKELERKINDYLAEMTHFRLFFKLTGEKLNVEIFDDVGNKNSMTNLSSGESARVNIASVLAIRSILSSLTNVKINLLFLDEVVGVIDAEGKEKISEILLRENLNTFIVSHDWTHPLVPRINIIKEKHISRIEHD